MPWRAPRLSAPPPGFTKMTYRISLVSDSSEGCCLDISRVTPSQEHGKARLVFAAAREIFDLRDLADEARSIFPERFAHLIVVSRTASEFNAVVIAAHTLYDQTAEHLQSDLVGLMRTAERAPEFIRLGVVVVVHQFEERDHF